MDKLITQIPQTDLDAKMFCPNCHKRVMINGKFCSECGARLLLFQDDEGKGIVTLFSKLPKLYKILSVGLVVFCLFLIAATIYIVAAIRYPHAPASEGTNTPTSQNVQGGTDTTIKNAQQVDINKQKTYSSNFIYTSNKDLSISINVTAEAVEEEAVKQWDTSLSGSAYSDTFEQIFSLHPMISGSSSSMQFLTFEIKSNVSFVNSSANELSRLFDSIMTLEGYVYPQTSTIVTVIDPSGNKIDLTNYQIGNGYATVSLSGNKKTIWEVLMGQNVPDEYAKEDAANKLKSAGQDLYNVFHGHL
ncbi:MAG: zinc ribbon domain-containing protein [Desulfitobacteriaceae bacterium]